jgi:hypothetical protein
MWLCAPMRSIRVKSLTLGSTVDCIAASPAEAVYFATVLIEGHAERYIERPPTELVRQRAQFATVCNLPTRTLHARA